MLWTALAVLLTWHFAAIGYIAVMAAKRVQDRGEVIHPVFLYPLRVAFVLGVSGDILFNIFAATWIFRELPEELLFTSRCKRHKAGRDGWRKDKAIEWCNELNKFAYPDKHC